MTTVYIETHTGNTIGGISPSTKAYNAMMSVYGIESDFSLSKILMNMFVGLSITNNTIQEVYTSWMSVKEEKSIQQSILIAQYDKACFYLVHDLRVFVDVAVSVLWILDNIEKTKIEVDGLDAYFRKNNKYYNDIIDKHKNFLEMLRLIDNGHKHSLINYHDRRIGIDEPCVYGVYNNYNDYSRPSSPCIVEVREVIELFNDFYIDFLDGLGENASSTLNLRKEEML